MIRAVDSVVVLGAGVAGLSAALALARDGQQVVLVERDEIVAGAPDVGFEQRRGIPHLHQPHAFIPRGRMELRAAFPDVLAALHSAGAEDVDLRPKIKGAPQPGDEDFAYVGARRPLIEWALRNAVLAEASIAVRSGTQVLGFEGRPGARPAVDAVRTSAGSIRADVVIDALGRRSPAKAWISALGGHPLPERSSDCGIVYYGRYYRVRSAQALPDGPWLIGPRGDLGYGGFSTFPGDNGTFAALIAIPPGDQELKLLRRTEAFDAASKLIPALHSWTNPDVAQPITDVMPYGSLQNTLRTVTADSGALGVISIGDAICHTDPALALGLSFALIHARAMVSVLRDHRDPADRAAAFDARTRADMDERYAYATSIDTDRARAWAGEQVDFAHRDGDAHGLFTLIAGTAAALTDGDIFRRVVRRNTFLDPLKVLDDDVEMQDRIERAFGTLLAAPRPNPGPPREDMLAAMRAALVSADG